MKRTAICTTFNLHVDFGCIYCQQNISTSIWESLGEWEGGGGGKGIPATPARNKPEIAKLCQDGMEKTTNVWLRGNTMVSFDSTQSSDI